MEIFIGLDISKISTALTIKKNNEIKHYSYTTVKSNNIWIKNTKDYIIYRHIEYEYLKDKDYSKSQIKKLLEFDKVTNLIIKDISDNVDFEKDTIQIGIEGFSYSSSAGPLIDIVEFSTFLKLKILHRINNISNIEILSPMTVKSETCKIAYTPRIELKGKRIIKEILHYENKEGKQATKFDKWDMLYALIDSNLNIAIKTWLLDNDNWKKNKDVPKPIDDIIDSLWIMYIKLKKYKI